MSQTLDTNVDEHLSRIEKDGYTIVRDILAADECRMIREKLDAAVDSDIQEFGEERLRARNDLGTVRALMSKDKYFMELALHPRIYPIVCETVGETAILHLQNAIIVYPQKKHYQSYYHRDFQKDFVCSKLLSLNVLWMIDDFNSQTGGTWLVPGSHKTETQAPDEELELSAIQVNEKAGSALIFDSRILHKGGTNVSQVIRRGINTQYTRPFIKQQIDLPEFLGDMYDIESKEGQLLGYWAIAPKSVDQFRCEPHKRTYRAGQG